ncbi:MAG: hypothetical protein F4W90_06075 [Gammaproteobacteria bacterium]|nr:hypothetical protein [Gammaproteobacteria bacterium]
MSAIDDDIVGIVDIEDPDTGTSSLVEIEWIGLDHALEGPRHKTRGANSTSIDAFVVAETTSGRRGYLIEWKYVEDYRRDFLLDGNDATRLEWYRASYAASSFRSERIPITAWFYNPFYQIMRQRLLAERMVRNGELGVREAKVVVVVPDDNLAYREGITSPVLKAKFKDARTVEEVVLAAIDQPGPALACLSPSTIADAVRRQCGNELIEWSEYLEDRYGW